MQELAEAIRSAISDGKQMVIGRVIGLEGFSTLPVDELIAIDNDGRQHGDLLGKPGAERLGSVAEEMFAAIGDGGLFRITTVSIHEPQVAELGLACGGQAEVLLQSTAPIPSELWKLLGDRAPVALITRIEGDRAGSEAVVIDGEGNSWGGIAGGDALIVEAKSLLSSGKSGANRVTDDSGVALIESWVPDPRLVVVGSGEVVIAIEAQAGLLGWDLRSTESVDDLNKLFDWAGATAALITLSHNPHVDVPSLTVGLNRGVAYVGAMGSRGTQSRRLEKMAADGIPAEQLDLIHRPIGLNLGGRRAPEVALAIVAEILACHNGRDARPLKDTTGRIRR